MKQGQLDFMLVWNVRLTKLTKNLESYNLFNMYHLQIWQFIFNYLTKSSEQLELNLQILFLLW